jgi:YVTN family beta-propeller protein
VTYSNIPFATSKNQVPSELLQETPVFSFYSERIQQDAQKRNKKMRTRTIFNATRLFAFVSGAVWLWLLRVPAHGQLMTTTVSTGHIPKAVAVNPVTNKIYVANQSDTSVTVIDGATNATATINVGSTPNAVAVNSATNKIYVVNSSRDSVTVIDADTNSTTSIAVGKHPSAVAVNTKTNKIYVTAGGYETANFGNVTVIDGATNATSKIGIGPSGPCAAGDCCACNCPMAIPNAVAVNEETNRIYVAAHTTGDHAKDKVTVIDGATNETTSVEVEGEPRHLVVNPVTNKVYAISEGRFEFPAGQPARHKGVVIIDGASNSASTIHLPESFDSAFILNIAVNPATNKIYVINPEGGVSIIDGATGAMTSVGMEAPDAVVVNPVTNKIYVANSFHHSITLIDGNTNATTMVSLGEYDLPSWRSDDPIGGIPIMAINPATNMLYVATSSDKVAVIDGSAKPMTTISTGDGSSNIAVDPVTNKVYVTNKLSNDMTVIDGATNSTETVEVGENPVELAVNPVTNKVYVINHLTTGKKKRHRDSN